MRNIKILAIIVLVIVLGIGTYSFFNMNQTNRSLTGTSPSVYSVPPSKNLGTSTSNQQSIVATDVFYGKVLATQGSSLQIKIFTVLGGRTTQDQIITLNKANCSFNNGTVNSYYDFITHFEEQTNSYTCLQAKVPTYD